MNGASCFSPPIKGIVNEACFTNYTSSQGLVDNNVFTIKEDKKGNIWLGTAGGVSCLIIILMQILKQQVELLNKHNKKLKKIIENLLNTSLISLAYRDYQIIMLRASQKIKQGIFGSAHRGEELAVMMAMLLPISEQNRVWKVILYGALRKIN